MFNVGSVNYRVFTMLNSDAGLVNSGYRFSYGAALNDNPEATPWVGVYPGELDVEPELVMAGNPPAWRGEYSLTLFHQRTSWAGSGFIQSLMFARDYLISLVHSNLVLDGQNLILGRVEAELVDADPATDESIGTDAIRLTYFVRNS